MQEPLNLLHSFTLSNAGTPIVVSPSDRRVLRLTPMPIGRLRLRRIELKVPERDGLWMRVGVYRGDALVYESGVYDPVGVALDVIAEMGDIVIVSVRNDSMDSHLVRGTLTYEPLDVTIVEESEVARGHTPGPWKISASHAGTVLASEPDREVGELADYGGQVIAESIETRNLTLVAAAPELLEVCERAYRCMGLPPMLREQMRVVLEKVQRTAT